MTRRGWMRRGSGSQSKKSPRSGNSRAGRVLCIDTLPVLISGYSFDKGVFVDTQQEV